jgi:hypothetical protein
MDIWTKYMLYALYAKECNNTQNKKRNLSGNDVRLVLKSCDQIFEDVKPHAAGLPISCPMRIGLIVALTFSA